MKPSITLKHALALLLGSFGALAIAPGCDTVCDVGSGCSPFEACRPPPDDGDPCTVERCDEGSPTRIVAPDEWMVKCASVDACGSPKVCRSGSCQPDGSCPCFGKDDGNPCTFDECVGDVAKHSPEPDGFQCDDNEECTPPGACQAGACVTAPPVVCGQGEVCSNGLCAKECPAPLGLALPAGPKPRSIAAADFNGDGKTDIVIVGDDGVRVKLGPAFSSEVYNAVGAGLHSVTAADLSGDGAPDLVVGDNSGAVSVLVNQGDGAFSAKVTYDIKGDMPAGAAAADLNGDGKVDVAAAAGLGVSVLLNQGSGVLGPEASYATGYTTNFVVTADLNGDSKIDLAGGGLMFPKLIALFNDGSGAFMGLVHYALLADAGAIAIADFNGDAKPDLAAASGGAAVFFNDGAGGFTYKGVYAKGQINSIVAADLNGDGAADLAVAGWSADVVSVLLNQGDGTFGSPAHFVAGAGPSDIVTADLDGDGEPDLAVTSADSDSVNLYFNTCIH